MEPRWLKALHTKYKTTLTEYIKNMFKIQGLGTLKCYKKIRNIALFGDDKIYVKQNIVRLTVYIRKHCFCLGTLLLKLFFLSILRLRGICFIYFYYIFYTSTIIDLSIFVLISKSLLFNVCPCALDTQNIKSNKRG